LDIDLRRYNFQPTNKGTNCRMISGVQSMMPFLWIYKKDTLLLIVVFTQGKISETRHPAGSF